MSFHQGKVRLFLDNEGNRISEFRDRKIVWVDLHFQRSINYASVLLSSKILAFQNHVNTSRDLAGVNQVKV